MSARDPFETCTEREMLLIKIMATGVPHKTIAAIMGTTRQVVRNRLLAIFDKVGCDSSLQLALIYVAWKREREAA